MKTPIVSGTSGPVVDPERKFFSKWSHDPRPIDYEIARLDGHIFDNLPKVDVPLDELAHPPGKGDSMRPVHFDSVPPAPPVREALDEKLPMDRRVFGWGAGVIALATMTGLLLGMAKRQQPAQLIDRSAPAAAAVEAITAPPEAPAAVEPPPAPEPAATENAQPAETAPPTEAAPQATARIATSRSTRSLSLPPMVVPADITPPDSAVAAPPRPFDRSRAAVAIAAAGREASACLSPDDSRANVPVSVTFAPSGRVTRAVVIGGAFMGTPQGSCIARTLRSATLDGFDEPAVEVNTSIHLR